MAQPIHKIKIGQWSISVWPNEKDGRTYYGYNLQRSYVKMQNGQPVLENGQKVWERQSVSFNKNDIQNIQMLLWKIFHWICFSQKPQPTQNQYGQQSQVTPPQQNTPFETGEDCPI